ncbi:hypothetical protein [Phascolarctobacterium sp.]
MNWNCNDDDKKKCTALATRDLVYICIIFIFIIIFLMTITMGCSSLSNQLFSFAATLVSIVLSILAIIMTIYSEYKNERAANSLSLAINTIETVSRNLREQTDAQIKELKDLNKEIRKEFDKINNKLDSMDCKIKIFVGNLKDTSSWIDNSGDKDE